MEADTIAMVAGLVALSTGLTKIIEKLVDKFVAKKSDNGSSDQSSDGKLDRLVAFVEQKDQNGVPLGYFPRSVVENQEKIAELLRDTAHAQEKIVDRLDRMDDKIDNVHEEVRIIRKTAMNGRGQ